MTDADGHAARPLSPALRPLPRHLRRRAGPDGGVPESLIRATIARAMFKFTSTGDGAKPTRADLKRTIVQGIPGTAMPSFALLPDDEIDALVGIREVPGACAARPRAAAVRLVVETREPSEAHARRCRQRADDADRGDLEQGGVAGRHPGRAAGTLGPIDTPDQRPHRSRRAASCSWTPSAASASTATARPAWETAAIRSTTTGTKPRRS